MNRRTTVGLTALAALNVVLVPLALKAYPNGSGVPSGPGHDDAGGQALLAPLDTGPVRDAATPVLNATSGLAVHAPATAACGAPSAPLRLSTDGGHNWRTVTVPATTVLRVLIADPRRIWLVGTGVDCRARVFHTVDAGSSWRTQESTYGTWHRVAEPGAKDVHAPRGPVRSPCPAVGPVVELVALDGASAAVRCRDGAVHWTGNSGRTWSAVAPGGVRALAFSGQRNLYAVEGPGGDCVGVRVSRRSGNGWQAVGCVADAKPDDAAALSFMDADAGLLVSGSATYSTSDGGRTWRRLDG
jgi:photosystem II stability/assembly factor-like uncharacterized protein